MITFILICIVIGLVAFGIWGAPKSGTDALVDLPPPPRRPPDHLPIALRNLQHIGLLMGMMGSSIEDAAIARFALQRFEQRHGRKPTFKKRVWPLD